MLDAFYIRVLNANKAGFADSEGLAAVLGEVCEALDITLRDATDYKAVATISDQITKALDDADVIFADGNSSNENVWYEIGYADRIKVRKVICLSREGRVLPFDRAGIRSIKYGDLDKDRGKLSNEILDAVKTIICEVNVRGLLKAGGLPEEFAQRVRNNMDTGLLREIAAGWLLNHCRDTRTDVGERQAAVRALSALDALAGNLDVLTDRFVDPSVRIVVYQEVARIRDAVSDAVWAISPDDLPGDLMRAFAKAAVQHWVDGNLPDAWFRQRVSRGGDPRMRAMLLEDLYKHASSAVAAVPTA